MANETSEFTATVELGQRLNNFSWSETRFADEVCSLHRTLQQTLFRTMVAVIKKMAAPDYKYDERNQAAHLISQKIVESGVLDNVNIPLI